MQKLLLFTLILTGVHISCATHFVTGTVKDVGTEKVLPQVQVTVKGTGTIVLTDVNGFYSIETPSANSTLIFSLPGYEIREVKVAKRKIVDVKLEFLLLKEEEEDVAAELPSVEVRSRKLHRNEAKMATFGAVTQGFFGAPELHGGGNTEGYSTIHENGFKKPVDDPLSTFSIDVDAASYSNMRRFLGYGQLPPKDAVRIEEMINYFQYDYEQPSGNDPFSIQTELTIAPWNSKHRLVQIGLQGKKIATEDLPPSNLVFLVDVSGSMQSANKLPLLKASFKMLVNELRPQDKVAIVVYAGAAGLVLPPTTGGEKGTIMKVLDELTAGGSTAGGAGIELAYKTAKAHFVEGGNNRVILATDGDFNVGASSNAAMERLIEKKREEGVFLTVLGYGMGNYKDDKIEILADKGNGNYAYIDNIKEAKKVFVNEFGGTLFTIAKDVKLQVEFNPAKVQAYRLIGYENRLLDAEDFNDDKKDAGELGSGHTVTALYEIIPVGVNSEFLKDIDDLKYQSRANSEKGSDEWLTVKFRYKQPDGEKSKLIVRGLKTESDEMSKNLQWASAVAGFGMLLRDSKFKGDLTYQQVMNQAKGALGKDAFGYRKEFVDLVETASRVQKNIVARDE